MNSRSTQLSRMSVFLEMIKFPHTVFALPFALTAAFLAAGGMPPPRTLFWIIMAMVSARTAAMGMNRLIDARIDGRNPRTATRAIPSGLISKGATFTFITLAIILLLVSAALLNPLCLKLSPVALFFLILYSYCKRFTSLAHLVLGICLAAAPLGAWIAVKENLEQPAVILAGAVALWVAGFDILYALQDIEFDRKEGLHSIPVSIGINGSLWLARACHLAMLGLLVMLYFAAGLGFPFLLGICVVTSMLLYEHWLLKDSDLSKLDAAFFTMNGYISIAVFLFTAADVLTRRG